MSTVFPLCPPFAKLDAAPAWLSTSQTAQILGLSVGTVQQMLNDGRLQGWKTEGGHRRIDSQALLHYLQQPDRPAINLFLYSQRDSMLSWVRSCVAQCFSRCIIRRFQQPLDLALCLGAERPALLVIDLNPLGDNEERALLASLERHSNCRPAHVLVSTNTGYQQPGQSHFTWFFPLTETTLLSYLQAAQQNFSLYQR